MQIKELLLWVPVLFFVVWVFIAPTPETRIQRTCEPINWVGSLATSTTALANEKHTQTSARWSDKLNYSCQYLIWRLLYQDDYLKAVEEGRVIEGADGKAMITESPKPAESELPSRIPPAPKQAAGGEEKEAQ